MVKTMVKPVIDVAELIQVFPDGKVVIRCPHGGGHGYSSCEPTIVFSLCAACEALMVQSVYHRLMVDAIQQGYELED